MNILTSQEIQEITGRQKSSAQIRCLQQMGFVVKPRADGKPIVSRAHFEECMGVKSGTSPPKQNPQPDFGAI